MRAMPEKRAYRAGVLALDVLEIDVVGMLFETYSEDAEA